MLKVIGLSLALLITGIDSVSAQITSPHLNRPSAEQQLPGLGGSSRYLASSDGTLIAVTDAGPRNSQATILLIHGFLHDSQVWFKQLNSPVLADFRIVTMDLRGHGYSARPTDSSAYTNLDLQADDIETVIHQLRLEKPVLVGWSLGGVSVQQYLMKYGDKELSGVDLVDDIACPDTDCQNSVLTGLAAFQSISEVLSTDANTALQGENSFINLETGGAETATTTVSPTDRVVLTDILHTSPQYVRADVFSVASALVAPVPQVLKNLEVPLLVQHGQNDPLFPATLIAGEAKLVKNITVRIYPNTAHMPFLLSPDAFNQDLAQWILTRTPSSLR